MKQDTCYQVGRTYQTKNKRVTAHIVARIENIETPLIGFVRVNDMGTTVEYPRSWTLEGKIYTDGVPHHHDLTKPEREAFVVVSEWRGKDVFDVFDTLQEAKEHIISQLDTNRSKPIALTRLYYVDGEGLS